MCFLYIFVKSTKYNLFCMDSFTFKKKPNSVFQRFPRHSQCLSDTKQTNLYKTFGKNAPNSQQFIPATFGTHFNQNKSKKRRKSIKSADYIRQNKHFRDKGTQHRHKKSHSNQLRHRARTLSQQFQQQRQMVRKAHRQEKRAFHKVWQRHFQEFREREMSIMLSFKQDQEVKRQKATQKLEKRVETHHSQSPNSRMNELTKVKKLMMKMQDFKGLAHINKQMKKEQQQRQRKREQETYRWKKAQELKLFTAQTKKYDALLIKLDDQWQDINRLYLKQQKRLKKKYKNYISEMQHCHVLYGTTLTDF